jgi:hypothetical protein
MTKLKLMVIAAVIVALAAVCAGWKWNGGQEDASPSHQIASWS